MQNQCGLALAWKQNVVFVLLTKHLNKAMKTYLFSEKRFDFVNGDYLLHILYNCEQRKTIFENAHFRK